MKYFRYAVLMIALCSVWFCGYNVYVKITHDNERKEIIGEIVKLTGTETKYSFDNLHDRGIALMSSFIPWEEREQYIEKYGYQHFRTKFEGVDEKGLYTYSLENWPWDISYTNYSNTGVHETCFITPISIHSPSELNDSDIVNILNTSYNIYLNRNHLSEEQQDNADLNVGDAIESLIYKNDKLYFENSRYDQPDERKENIYIGQSYVTINISVSRTDYMSSLILKPYYKKSEQNTCIIGLAIIAILCVILAFASNNKSLFVNVRMIKLFYVLMTVVVIAAWSVYYVYIIENRNNYQKIEEKKKDKMFDKEIKELFPAVEQTADQVRNLKQMEIDYIENACIYNEYNYNQCVKDDLDILYNNKITFTQKLKAEQASSIIVGSSLTLCKHDEKRLNARKDLEEIGWTIHELNSSDLTKVESDDDFKSLKHKCDSLSSHISFQLGEYRNKYKEFIQ